MDLPYFHIPAYDPAQTLLILGEETSRHMVQVLRMGIGELLQLTDGKGNILTAEITLAHKNHCEVKVRNSVHQPASTRKISVAISLLKNTDRMEWFLEKATEIGVSEILPFISIRTEKKQFRLERLKAVLVSAMIQSQQVWLPELHDPVPFSGLVRSAEYAQKFIAHCQQDAKKLMLVDALNGKVESQIILIGPEGDFASEEINQALAATFIPVSLGENRLRSETAGVVAASLLKML